MVSSTAREVSTQLTGVQTEQRSNKQLCYSPIFLTVQQLFYKCVAKCRHSVVNASRSDSITAQRNETEGFFQALSPEGVMPSVLRNN